MAYSFVYHVFNKQFYNIIDLQRCPIIFSILTIRNFDSLSEIFVFDYTSQNHDWMDLPSKLNFHVIKTKNRYQHIPLMFQKNNNIIDNIDLFSEYICSIDSDVFFVDKIHLQKTNKLSVYFQQLRGKIRVNTGFYFFQKKTHSFETFKKWTDLVDQCFLNNIDITHFLQEHNFLFPSEESILGYLLNQGYDSCDNYLDISLVGKNYIYEKKRGYHILSNFTDKKKDFILGAKEINDVVSNSIKKFACDIKIGSPTFLMKNKFFYSKMI